jgi:hypothetical protein
MMGVFRHTGCNESLNNLHIKVSVHVEFPGNKTAYVFFINLVLPFFIKTGSGLNMKNNSLDVILSKDIS